MKAVVYQAPFNIAAENVPDPELQHPNDVIVKITSSCICGSDLHMYEGRTAAQPGIIFGHENMGVIQEVGSAVKTLNVGDRVVMPFNAACGFCENCQRGFTGFCTTVNPGFAGGAYGYVAMGPSRGGRAEYLQVPFRYRPGVGSGDKGYSGRPDGNDPSATGSHNIGAFVKGGEKVYHCGGGIVYHRQDEKELNWEPGGVRSGAGVLSSGVSQESPDHPRPGRRRSTGQAASSSSQSKSVSRSGPSSFRR